jgi:hypothetical protein
MRGTAESLPSRPRVALILEGGNAAAAERTARSLMRQVYPAWELWLPPAVASAVADEILPAARCRLLPREYSDVAAALNAALDGSTADFVATIDAGDELAPHALFEIAVRLNAEPDLDLLYSDEDERTESGIHRCPHFKPGWSPEHLLARMYLGRLLVIRRAVAREAGGYRPDFGAALDYDLALRVSPPASRVGHVSRVLYHRASANRDLTESGHPDAAQAIAAYCGATGRDAEVTAGGVAGVWRVRHRIVHGARVTIVIRTGTANRCSCNVSGASANGRHTRTTIC